MAVTVAIIVIGILALIGAATKYVTFGHALIVLALLVLAWMGGGAV